MNTVNEHPHWVPSQVSCRLANVLSSLTASCRNDQNAKATCGSILVGFIESDLSLPTFSIFFRAYALGPVVQLDYEIELLVGKPDAKRAVWIQGLITDRQAERVFATEVDNRESTCVRSNNRMNNEVGEVSRMRLMGEADIAEMPSVRWVRIRTVQQPVADECQSVVIGRSAPTGGGVLPPTQPAGMSERRYPSVNSGFALEGLLERDTDFQQLLDGQRTPIDGREDLQIARGQQDAGCFSESAGCGLETVLSSAC